MNYNFTVPVVYNPEDNGSYIGKQTILIKDCSIFNNPNNGINGYNCNKCPNDDAYCQPFIKGDKLYFQFIIDKTVYNNQSFQLIDSNTGLPITSNFDYSTTQGYIDRVNYFTIVIDTTTLIETCFYLKLTLDKPGNTITPQQDFITSEPFCSVRCDEATLLIEGEYIKYDCDLHYYGLGNGTPAYKASFRVRGVVEPQGFEIEKTNNGINPVKSKQRERFTLFTEKVPYYVAKQIETCFNSKQLTINGVKYTGEVKLDKNFEEGSEWIIKEDIFIECAEINFGCDI